MHNPPGSMGSHKVDLRQIDLNLLVVFDVLMAERSVTRAAERLNRTQPAISHALARLREQLDDPILVRGASGMLPSPLALELIEQVRPILRNVERLLMPRQAFDASRSERIFHVSVPEVIQGFFPQMMQRLRKQAPSIKLLWASPTDTTMVKLAEEQVDLAIAPICARIPDGISRKTLGSLHWHCFARQGHPAFEHWDVTAWCRWPHAVVLTGTALRNPVDEVANLLSLERHVSAWVPSFAAVAPLLETSDLIATLPDVVMVDAMQRFALQARPVPFDIAPIKVALLWNSRLGSDPAIGWLLAQLTQVIEAEIDRAAALRQ